MDKQSNLVFLSLWKVLPKGKQFTPSLEGKAKGVPECPSTNRGISGGGSPVHTETRGETNIAF